MFTYTYERQDIIQIALKRLPGGRERRKKKGLSDQKNIVTHFVIFFKSTNNYKIPIEEE
jgi:hypothetical protein